MERTVCSYPKNPGLSTKTTCHVPLLPGTVPIRSPPYRASPAVMAELKTQVSELLENGTVTKSNSAWAFPVVLVSKPDGTWRFCVDYSRLNKHVIRDTFPLPRIDDYLDRLSKSKIFTVLDLASGFWQIPVEEEDKEKLSFVTPFGTYKWK